MPAHDCTPNSSWVIQANSEFTLRASVPIQSGESITQLYSQPTAGTQERQVHLRQSKFFDCTCKRCLDPTELGTFFSAIKCPVCPDGYLLLETPTDVLSNWKCDNDKCVRVIPEVFVEDVLERIRSDLLNLQNNSEESNSGQLKSVGVIEKLLKTHQGKTVHPNHYTMHTLENELLQRMSFVLSSSYLQNGNEKDNIADRMVQLARKNVTIADIIWPGFNRHRGRLLYFLQQGLLIPLNRVAGQKRAKKLPANKLSELKSIFEEVLQTRKTVHAILSIEPAGREESFIANMMTENSEEILNLRKIFKN
ncbi:unnamed protein product [Allacma fusca]|uniref:SET domain-containing protein n=1 Tax=Allacma fusca TaxID=39272 RepID=A0A8J2KID5_9HEXA|nr:unnamed protein product [Allacma fusca]